MLEHLPCLIFDNTSALLVYSGLIIIPVLFSLVHQVLRCLLSILKLFSILHQSLFGAFVDRWLTQLLAWFAPAPILLEVFRRHDDFLNLSWFSIPNDKFLCPQLACLLLLKAPQMLSCHQVWLEGVVLHFQLLVLLSHLISESFSLFIFHYALAI